MNTNPQRNKTAEQRFLEKFKRGDGCWLWLAAKYGNGYGAFWADGDNTEAHRFSYKYFIGPIQPGKFILHSCDVRLCVNPSHLRPGTPKENINDAKTRGRLATGDKNGSRRSPEKLWRGSKNTAAKLKESDIPVIRELYSKGLTQAAIGGMFGVGQDTISCVVRFENWAHVGRQ